LVAASQAAAASEEIGVILSVPTVAILDYTMVVALGLEWAL
jgi:hypothetical protein